MEKCVNTTKIDSNQIICDNLYIELENILDVKWKKFNENHG